MQTATVQYQIATYSGEINVCCHEDDDTEHIAAKAENLLRHRYGSLPFGYRQFNVIDRRYQD